MSVCYKCGSTEELSKKTKHLMICRPCRRAYAASRKDIKKQDNSWGYFWGDEWERKAQESIRFIMSRRWTPKA